MRIKVLIMSSLLLLALFAIKSYSVDWDNPEGQSADHLIAGPDQGTVIPSSVLLKLRSRQGQLRLDSREKIF